LAISLTIGDGVRAGAADEAALFHAPKSRLRLPLYRLGFCYSRRQLWANAAIAPSRVGS
jgi:hypothetical protein